MNFAPAVLALVLSLPAASRAQGDGYKWMKLWNGKDLSGWNHLPQYFKVDSGMIVARGRVDGYNTFCATKQSFSDFELTIRARLYEKGLTYYTNTGIQYRSKLVDDNRKILQGYQLDIGDNVAASMYPEGGYPAGQKPVGSSAACKAAMRTDEFNIYTIRAEGKKVSHRLNGALCNEYPAAVEEGLIGLQLHSVYGPGSTPATVMEADFKEILIRPLNNSFEIPDSLAYYEVRPDPLPIAVRDGMRVRGSASAAFGRGSRFIGRAGAVLSAFDPLGHALPARIAGTRADGETEWAVSGAAGGIKLLRSGNQGRIPYHGVGGREKHVANQ